jgi:hypothetical protein
MSNIISKEGSRERGASLLILALGAVALIAMLALAVDGGFAFSQKRRMQIAADAAAMAGGRVLALNGNSSQVSSAVDQFAIANGAQSATCTIVSNETERIVEVTASTTFPTFFAGIVGRPHMTASASARSAVQGISEAGSLLPMIVEDHNFVVGQTYHLWFHDLEAPGNFGWVDWDGDGSTAIELSANILNPENSGVWHIGDWVEGAVAVVATNHVRSALDGWVYQHVTIPLYDLVVEQGTLTLYRISGFAEFEMQYHQLLTGDKKVTGSFIQWVEEGGGGGPDHGLTVVKLIE